MQITVNVNGVDETREVEPRLLLVHFLRETLGLTGTASARARWNVIGYVTAVVIAGGFALVPLSVLFGIVD